MNNLKYQQILYFISIVILLTLCVQGFWTYKNYETEKRQLISDVQVSLDNALDAYYTAIAKQNTLSYITDSISNDSIFMGIRLKDFNHQYDSLDHSFEKYEIKDSSNIKKISIITSNQNDSSNFSINDNPKITYKINDSTRGSIPKHLELLTSKIVVSFTEDSLSLNKIDSLILQELKRKKLSIKYGIYYKNEWNKNQQLRPQIINNSSLTATAGTSLLLDGSTLKMYYDNITLEVLQRNTTSLFLSFLLATSIIFSLLYLLKIIQKQKELAEIKNDLISNITHEFKTPLATISVALEGIQKFNQENDGEKSKKYAEMSKQEVEKLTFMVEKLLETATLDSDTLQLNFEETDLIALLENASTIELEMLQKKHISFTSSLDVCILKVDRFHFENAINNILDNAIKYGGDKIEVTLQKNSSETIIKIKDNGKNLNKQQAAKIFEKFYRVPKGNMHNVKGFGIGLYYTKNIIEKHQGTIEVAINNGTEFKISIPNG